MLPKAFLTVVVIVIINSKALLKATEGQAYQEPFRLPFLMYPIVKTFIWFLASHLSPQNTNRTKGYIFLYIFMLHLPFSYASSISSTIGEKTAIPSKTDSTERWSSEPWEHLRVIKVCLENCFSWFKFNLDSSSVPILKEGHYRPTTWTKENPK